MLVVWLWIRRLSIMGFTFTFLPFSIFPIIFRHLDSRRIRWLRLLMAITSPIGIIRFMGWVWLKTATTFDCTTHISAFKSTILRGVGGLRLLGHVLRSLFVICVAYGIISFGFGRNGQGR
jgi:hypothetical protein